MESSSQQLGGRSSHTLLTVCLCSCSETAPCPSWLPHHATTASLWRYFRYFWAFPHAAGKQADRTELQEQKGRQKGMNGGFMPFLMWVLVHTLQSPNKVRNAEAAPSQVVPRPWLPSPHARSRAEVTVVSNRFL